MLYDILQEKRELILKIASGHGIQNVRIFGSVAKFKDEPTSGLDLIKNGYIKKELNARS